MPDLVTGVDLLVIGLSGLPQFPEDLEPSLAQEADGTGVAFALLAFLLVVDLGPGALLAAAIGPQVHRRPQVPVAGPPELHDVNLARLEADRGGPAVALKSFMVLKSPAVLAALAQQPRSQHGPGAGQRTEQIVVRVFPK